MGIPSIGPGELILILIIALVVLGPGKLPDVASSLGKSIREFRRAASEVSDAAKLETTPTSASSTSSTAADPAPAPVAPASAAPAPVAPPPIAPSPAAQPPEADAQSGGDPARDPNAS